MKRTLLISSLLLVLVSFTACKKYVSVPSPGALSGSWIVTETKESNGYGWRYFNSGLENGVFDFYSNGSAKYDDGYNRMNGTWLIRSVVGGYYDQYGDYYNGRHDMFEIHVYDRYTGSSVDLFFDDVVYTGNRLIATLYRGGYVSRYVFSRY
ncbi:hypothetical protein [Sediminibacterium ginsengisoli]|uniref:Lipocalin-like domain-containing protein n=1 Tax=Sediminibacterium ginsengisoli TaxID=413434 RepID=A0A1T4PYP8_9BACT|nr:hypothetical protein [Sediminibacterium ginsengisoli]SJZ96605.1 hypothetical protein SAMN04488132_10739 [Sediminibacterium ginsengisoli]